jgi:hypothetical protein
MEHNNTLMLAKAYKELAEHYEIVLSVIQERCRKALLSDVRPEQASEELKIIAGLDDKPWSYYGIVREGDKEKIATIKYLLNNNIQLKP